MDIKYEPGMVLNLYEDDDNEYCVIKIVEIDNYQYLLLQLLEGDKEPTKIELDKLHIIKLTKTNEEFEFVKDNEIIKKVIIQVIKEEQNK